MNRMQRGALLLLLIEKLKEHGSWCGETHIQKASYLLQEMAGVPLEFEFIPYKHGPFSFDLSDEIMAMRADNLMRLCPQPYPYGPSILPGEGSEALKDRFPKTVKNYNLQAGFVAEIIGNKKADELERLATALYVTREEKTDADLEYRAQRIHDLKPHITLDEALNAAKTVDQLMRRSKEIVQHD